MANGSNTPRPAKGRRTENRQWEKDTQYRDTIPPESAQMGMLAKQDEIIDLLVAFMAKLDTQNTAQNGAVAGSTLDTDFAATFTDDLQKVNLM